MTFKCLPFDSETRLAVRNHELAAAAVMTGSAMRRRSTKARGADRSEAKMAACEEGTELTRETFYQCPVTVRLRILV